MGKLIGAVEAGGTKFVLALANSVNEVLDRAVITTRTPAETFAEMIAWFDAAQARYGRIGAFGIGSFGPIGTDPAKPDFAAFTTTPKPGWSGASFVEALAAFGVPLALDTDVNAAALGEAIAGAGVGRNVIAYTTVGTGIGSGIVKNGKVASGLSHYEAGHLRVPHDRDTDPFDGVCAYHGDCCEGLASGPAIRERWGQDLSILDDPAKTALIGNYIGHLAAALASLHMPEVLIFGGGVTKSPGLLEAVRRSMRQSLAGYLTYYDRDLADIVVSPMLGDDAGITGAIILGYNIMESQTT